MCVRVHGFLVWEKGPISKFKAGMVPPVESLKVALKSDENMRESNWGGFLTRNVLISPCHNEYPHCTNAETLHEMKVYPM